MKRLSAELNMRILHLRRYLEAIDQDADLSLPRIDPDEAGGADRVAASIRRAWLIPDGSIGNLSAYCERAGIIVIQCKFAEKVDGVTMRVRGMPPLIFLNQNALADRMRHSLAHELGHLVMHSVPTEEMEDEADTFAGELLAPMAQVRTDLIGGRVMLERLVQLKLYWKVSVASLLYKVCKSGFISQNQSGYLWKQLSSRGWRTREPDETQFPKETTALYSRILDLHLEEMGYSPIELMRLLRVEADVLKGLYGVTDTTRSTRHLRVVK